MPCARRRSKGYMAVGALLILLGLSSTCRGTSAFDSPVTFQRAAFSISEVRSLEHLGSITLNGSEQFEVLQAQGTSVTMAHSITLTIAYNDIQGAAEYTHAVNDGISWTEYPGRITAFSGASTLTYEGRRLLSLEPEGRVGAMVCMKWNETASLNATYVSAQVGENTWIWLGGTVQLHASYQVADWIYRISDTSIFEGHAAWIGEYRTPPTESAITWDQVDLVALHRTTQTGINGPEAMTLENRLIQHDAATSTTPQTVFSPILPLLASIPALAAASKLVRGRNGTRAHPQYSDLSRTAPSRGSS